MNSKQKDLLISLMNDTLDGFKQAYEDEGYDLANETHYIESALKIVKSCSTSDEEKTSIKDIKDIKEQIDSCFIEEPSVCDYWCGDYNCGYECTEQKIDISKLEKIVNSLKDDKNRH